MSNFCSKCNVKLSIKNSDELKGKPICKECLIGINKTPSQNFSISSPLESKFDLFSKFTLILAIIVAICGVLLIISSSNTFTFSIIIGLIIQLLLIYLLLKGCGEVIRLLKKLNNFPYAGQISTILPEEYDEVKKVQPIIMPDSEFKNLRCSDCNAFVTEDAVECHSCGEAFEEEKPRNYKLIKICPICNEKMTDPDYCTKCGIQKNN